MTVATWTRMPFSGGFIAGFGRDRADRPISAIISGKRGGPWYYLLQRIDERAKKVEVLCRGEADKKLNAMRDAEDMARGYFMLAPYGKGEAA